MAILTIFGNVLDILEGRVETKMLRPIKSANFRFALGGSSFSDEHGVGETLLINGIPHITWVENNQLYNESHDNAKSAFLVGLDWNQSSNLPLQTISKNTSIESLYEELALKYPMGIALAGHFKMSKLSCVYLKRPPIYHENVNKLHDKYWSSIENHSPALIFLFGVIIPPKAKETYSADILKRAFYQNPSETTQAPFDSHTHGALVDKPADANETQTFLDDLSQLKVSGVRHVLTSSVIQEGKFCLYPIDQVRAI